MRRRSGWLAALVAVSVWAGCARPGPALPARPQGRPGGALVLALDRDPGSLDPARAVDAASAQVLALIHEGLVRALPDGRVVPGLAERWSVSADGRTYRFHLRRGARFHSGRAVTAADVVFSFRRLLDPAAGSPRAWVLEDLEGAEAFRAGLAPEPSGLRALDDATVELRLVRPSGTLLQRLAMPAAAVLDREAAEQPDGPAAAGAGPFRLAAWRPGQEIALEAHEGYHAGRPYLDGVRFRLDLDREGVLRELAAGRLGAADLTPAERTRLFTGLRWQGGDRRGVRPAVYYLALNHRRRPLSDPAVRQAIYHAIDRRAVLDELLGDGYVLAEGAIPPGVPGYDPGRRGYAYDPLQARQLLAQAGVPGGFELTLVQTASPFVHALNARIADFLGRVGIRVRTLTLDRQRFDQAVRAGEADAFVLSWWADYLDPEDVLLPLFHSARAGDGGNRAFFAVPEVDRALEELAATVDAEARAVGARRLEDAIFARVPWVPLFFPVRHWVTQPGLHGVDPPALPHGESLWDAWWEAPR